MLSVLDCMNPNCTIYEMRVGTQDYMAFTVGILLYLDNYYGIIFVELNIKIIIFIWGNGVLAVQSAETPYLS